MECDYRSSGIKWGDMRQKISPIQNHPVPFAFSTPSPSCSWNEKALSTNAGRSINKQDRSDRQRPVKRKQAIWMVDWYVEFISLQHTVRAALLRKRWPAFAFQVRKLSQNNHWKEMGYRSERIFLIPPPPPSKLKV